MAHTSISIYQTRESGCEIWLEMSLSPSSLNMYIKGKFCSYMLHFFILYPTIYSQLQTEGALGEEGISSGSVWDCSLLSSCFFQSLNGCIQLIVGRDYSKCNTFSLVGDGQTVPCHEFDWLQGYHFSVKSKIALGEGVELLISTVLNNL